MRQHISWAFRAANGVALVGGLFLAGSELWPNLRIDPIAHVRRTAVSLQRDTMGKDGRIVYQEVVGYFPVPPTMAWEIETNESWGDYQKAVREELEGAFRFLPGEECLYGVWRMGGEVQHLDVELLTDNKPIRVRCSLVIARDSGDP